MTYKITSRTEALVTELGQLAGDIDGDLIAAASPDARQEWNALRLTWPTADQIRAGAIALCEDELAFMVGKVHRFRSILRGLNVTKTSRAPALAAGAGEVRGGAAHRRAVMNSAARMAVIGAAVTLSGVGLSGPTRYRLLQWSTR